MRRALLAASAAVLLAVPAWAGLRARYGGELRVVLPNLPPSPDPALAVTPSELAVARLGFDTLLALDGEGRLAPALAAAVPEADATGRVFKLRLRPGVRFQGGAAASPQDVANSLRRLADPALRAPAGALTAALAPSGGVTVTAEGDIQVSLAFPYPDWPRALAHPAASIVSLAAGAPVGTGPFARTPADGELRFAAFADAALGRPFLDALRVGAGDPRTGARALARGEADLAAVPGTGRAGAALVATYLSLNPARLGAQLARVRQAVDAGVDAADLTRYFVRGPAEPMAGLLPSALTSAAAPRARPAKAALPSGAPLTLVVDETVPDHAAVAGRLQVRLHDQGAAVRVSSMPRAEFRRALAAGDYDLALVAIPLLPEPGLALAQLVDFARGRDRAREELRALGAPVTAAARRFAALARAAQLGAELPLVPLYAQGLRLDAAAAVAPVAFDGLGVPLIGDLWLAPRNGRR